MTPATTSIPLALSFFTASRIGHGLDVSAPLDIACRASTSGVSTSAEYGGETGVVEQVEQIVVLGDVERRLEGEGHRKAVFLLPRHELRQQFAQGAPVADEIVIDE